MKNLLFSVLALCFLAACNKKEILPEPSPTPEALTAELETFKTETVENLALSEVQEAQLHKALAQSVGNADKPGFLWLVARHLSKTLPDAEKDHLLARIELIEQHLLNHGQCIPIGFEINHQHPLQPSPDLIASLLRAEQVTAFEAAVQHYQAVAQQLIALRINGSISPEEFFARMQENYNSTMALIINNILDDGQKLQLMHLMQQAAAQREQYIRDSYACMIAALDLEESTAQALLAEILEVENLKNDHYELFHTGMISLDELIASIQDFCGEYQQSLEGLLSPLAIGDRSDLPGTLFSTPALNRSVNLKYLQACETSNKQVLG